MNLALFYFLLLTFYFVSPAFPQAKPGWEAEWEKTVKAASGEGQVTVYAFAGGPELPIEAGVFQKRFPEIKVVTVSGDPVPRILAERRAGKYIADVAIGGATTPWALYQAGALDPLKDAMILPEVLDESKWWQGKHGWIDAERRYALPFLGNPQRGGIFYNSQLIRPKDFQSFWDFRQPEMEREDPSARYSGSRSGHGQRKNFSLYPWVGVGIHQAPFRRDGDYPVSGPKAGGGLACQRKVPDLFLLQQHGRRQG